MIGVYIDEDYPMIDLGFWQQGHGWHRLWDRLRQIWQIMWHGHPYCDNVVLTKEEAKNLRYALTTFIVKKYPDFEDPTVKIDCGGHDK
jgi:hypothetical protein